MRSLGTLSLLWALAGCSGPYDDGWVEGCYQGDLDGSMWAGVDAALCYSANPTPGPVISGPTRYDEGYVDGYNSCFAESYLIAYDIALYTLEADLGPCETLQ